jgi:hypothetical protein
MPLSVLSVLLPLLPLVSAQARCQYYPLRNAADLFREAQTFGELDPSFAVSPNNFTFLQNGKPTTPAASILSTPLEVDLETTLIDQENCAVYTELIVADKGKPHVIGAQIHFGFRDSDGFGLEATSVEIVKAATGSWQFNASATLGYVRGEDWEAIPQTERTGREGLVGAADAFLSGAAVVPFGTPCSRLEGSVYTPEVCSGGLVGKGVSAAEKRYVVDEVVGGVNVLFEGSDTVESYTFRVLQGKLRYVHHLVVAKEPA